MRADWDGEYSAGAVNACATCERKLCAFISDDNCGTRPVWMSLERGGRLEATRGQCLKFWTIMKGTAAICTAFEDGRRQIVGLETEGDTICGLMSTDETETWLEALEDCQICELDYSARAHELRGNAAFVSAVFGVTHQRLEMTSRHVATLGRLDSTERVILFLAEMARRTEARPGRGTVTSLPMSREDIADYLGLNAETVSRIMSRIKKSGLINFISPTDYVVPDFAAIERRLPVAVPAKRPSFLGMPTGSDGMIVEASE